MSQKQEAAQIGSKCGSVAQTRLEALWMAQQYYPESLAHGYVCYPPLLFNVLWRAAQPFLDAVTKCAEGLGLRGPNRGVSCSKHVMQGGRASCLGT